MNQFGNVLKEKRTEKKLTQQSLADAVHVDRSTISKWERNIGAPDIIQLKALADVFGITVEEIVYSDKQTDSQTNKENRQIQEDEALFEAVIIAGLYLCMFLLDMHGIAGTILLLYFTWKRKMSFYVYLLGLAVLFHDVCQLVIFLS